MDTPAIGNDTSIVQGTGLAGVQHSDTATYLRPKPRAAKEKTFRDLIKARQKDTPIELDRWAIQMVQLLRERDQESRRQQNRDIATFFQYYDSNEYGEFNEAGDWIPDADDDDFTYSVPIVPAHVDAGKTLLLKTSLEYEYAAKSKVSTLDAQVASMCKQLAEEDMTRIMTDDLRIDELLYLLLAGKSYRKHYWARDPLDPQVAESLTYSNEETDGDSFKACGNPECGARLEDDAEICTTCMSDKIDLIEGPKVTKLTARSESVTLAQNQMYVPNPIAVQHDLSKSNIYSSFLIERDTLPRAEAEFLYQQVLLGNRQGISEEMNIARELERRRLRASNLSIDQDTAAIRSMFGGQTDLVERERAWLPVWQYATVMISGAHWYKTNKDGLFWSEDEADNPENAEKVKEGSFLGDIYPDGLFLCVVDDNLVEINGVSVAEVWIKLICGRRPANTDGAGMRRLRPLADMINDATNLEFKVLMDDADPKTFLLKKYLSHLSKVGEYHLVDNMPNEIKLEDIAYRLQGASAHPDLGAMAERVHGMAQFVAGTFSSMGAGAPDIKAAGTATGVVKMAEEAAGRYLEAILAIKTADIESRYKVLKNRQKNSLDPQKQELVKRFGQDVTKRFFTANLRQIVKITVKDGTDQPQSQAIRLAQLQAYSQAVGSIPIDNPNLVGLIESFAQMIDLPVTVGVGETDKEEADRRISIVREACEQYADQPAPQGPDLLKVVIGIVGQMLAECEQELPIESAGMDGAPMPPPAPPMPVNPGAPPAQPEPDQDETPTPPPTVVMMQNHAVFMDAIKDQLMTEAAQSNNPVYRACLGVMWKLHFARQIAKDKETARIQGDTQLMLEGMKADFAAAHTPPPPDPATAAAGKIIESLNFKDLPPDAQAELLNKAGIPTSGRTAQTGPSLEDQKALEDHKAGHRIAEKVIDHLAQDHAKDADLARQEAAKNSDLGRQTIAAEHSAALNADQQGGQNSQNTGAK